MTIRLVSSTSAKIMNEGHQLEAACTMESNVSSARRPGVGPVSVAYAEPGFWTLTDSEARTSGAPAQGRFVIFDDFAENRGGDWNHVASQMARVIPAHGGGTRRHASDLSCVFEIPHPERFVPPYGEGLRPVYYGLFEDNDPTKRLAIANYNNDISVRWEFRPGFAPISGPTRPPPPKLGVNYIIYGLTHWAQGEPAWLPLTICNHRTISRSPTA